MCISAFRFAILSSGLAATVFPATLHADPMPSAESIRALIESKEYQPAIVDVNRLLALKGDMAVSDRDELFVLRGEADLGLRERDAAIASFSSAVKESTDAKEADIALATQTLIEKSPGLRYTPKHQAAVNAQANVSTTANEIQQPIDIVPVESRHKAFIALTPRVKSVSDQANDLLNTNWQASNQSGGQGNGPGGAGGRR